MGWSGRPLVGELSRKRHRDPRSSIPWPFSCCYPGRGGGSRGAGGAALGSGRVPHMGGRISRKILPLAARRVKGDTSAGQMHTCRPFSPPCLGFGLLRGVLTFLTHAKQTRPFPLWPECLPGLRSTLATALPSLSPQPARGSVTVKATYPVSGVPRALLARRVSLSLSFVSWLKDMGGYDL